MRIVFDTNVLIAAFISRGVCAELIEHCVVNHTLVGAQFILQEIQENLRKKFKYSVADVGAVIDLLEGKWMTVNPKKLPSPVCRDSNDDTILATAIAGYCRCLITGDKDLLVLENYQGIAILKPNQFWQYEKKIQG